MRFRWGPEFVMIYNDGYRSILGSKHPAAFGLPFHQAWPEVQTQLRPLHEAILNGTSGAFFAEDLLIRSSDAALLIGKTLALPLATARCRTKSSYRRWRCARTAVETTNRVRTEEALRISEERFAGIFEQTRVGIVHRELDGRFLLVNRRYCEIVGRTADRFYAARARHNPSR